jgi:hypothetical protein
MAAPSEKREHTLLFFEAARQRFATPAVDVVRCLAAAPSSPSELPHTLVDLPSRLGAEATAPNPERRILVLRGQQGRGVLVDAVHDIVLVAASALRRLPPWFGEAARHPWVWGAISNADGEPTLVLDLYRLES